MDLTSNHNLVFLTGFLCMLHVDEYYVCVSTSKLKLMYHLLVMYHNQRRQGFLRLAVCPQIVEQPAYQISPISTFFLKPH